ncbi:unnamed protein product [Heligmosomoides polygyrus]|uniref:Methyltranfer_dom domain-containing protein n=1 Tax=Heligmosomoides polygyrus TaxID=6339 RepID=A0A3P8D5D2_HELPZ|nr:unnamed protein product [Heligmosomoides polygyrus]
MDAFVFQILSLLQENVRKNDLANICGVMGLDWQSDYSASAVLDGIDELDCIVASDVFYDVCTFRPLLATIGRFMQRFRRLRFYFSYAERDDNWSIEDLLLLHNLQGRIIQTRDLGENTVQICVVYRRETMEEVFCGVEGGATESKLIFVNAAGHTLAESSTAGTNFTLNGIERTVNDIAFWVRESAAKSNIPLPLKGLVSKGPGEPVTLCVCEHCRPSYYLYLRVF